MTGNLGRKRPDVAERMSGPGNPMRGKFGALNPMFGKTGKNNPNWGRKHKPESLRKMRDSSIGTLNPMFGKKNPHLTKRNKEHKPTGSLHPNWKGGRKKDGSGYVLIWFPDHHRMKKDGYVFEHILVAELKYGREISRPEVIHHIDLDKSNNDPDNLTLFKNMGDHMAYHRRLRRYYD